MQLPRRHNLMNPLAKNYSEHLGLVRNPSIGFNPKSLQSRLKDGYRRHLSPNLCETRNIGMWGNLGQYVEFGAQWTLEDNFDNNGLYTTTGTKVTVDSGQNDTLYYNAAENGTLYQVHRSLGFTMSNTAWYARWQVNFGLITIPSHPYMQFTSATGDISSTSADRLGVQITDTSTSASIYADGSTDWTALSSIGVVISTQYYEEEIRLSATSLKHAIYSDSGYSSNISGSPDTDTIASTIQSLANFQSSNYSPASGSRILTASINALKINNGATAPP
jgi:hypothetical protein